jgi:hypothetical protein
MKKDGYAFRYQLSYDEAYEAFYLLAFRRSKTFKVVAGSCLILLAAAMLILYALDPRKLHYFYIAIIAVILLFYLIYVPALKARHGAKAVAKTGGTYELTYTEEGSIILPGGIKVQISGDKSARFIETDRSLIIRTDSAHTFCIPKRVMKEEEIYGLKKLLNDHLKH